MRVFAIKDEKAGFLNLVIEKNVEIAKYNFGRGFYCEKPELGRLEDYNLYDVGEFNESIGLIPTESTFVINGLVAYNDFVSRINTLHLEHLQKVGQNNDTELAREAE